MTLPAKVKSLLARFSTAIGSIEISTTIKGMSLLDEAQYQIDSDFSDAISDIYIENAIATLLAADIAGFKEINEEEVVSRFREILTKQLNVHKNRKEVRNRTENNDEHGYTSKKPH